MMLLLLLAHLFNSLYGSLHSIAADHPQNLLPNFRVDCASANKRAAFLPCTVGFRHTAIGSASMPGIIADVQHTTTMLTAEQPGEQRGAAAAGMRAHAGFHVRVAGNHGLVALILLPRNVTGMMFANQYVPLRSGSAMPVGLSGSTVHNTRLALRAAECIGAGVH